MRLKKIVRCMSIGAFLGSFCLACFASTELEAIMKARNLSEKDILAAAKTYQPSGRKDDSYDLSCQVRTTDSL